MKGPIAGNSPCGDDLANDESYTEIEQRIRQTHPEYERLDWTGVASKCQDLLDRTRDLRLGMIWSLAQLRTGGFSEWTTTIEILTAWIKDDKIWAGLYPQRLGARMLLVGQFAAEYATPGEFTFVRTIHHLPLADAHDPNARTLSAWEEGRREQLVRAVGASSEAYVDGLARDVRESSRAFKELCSALLQRLPGDDEVNRERLLRLQRTLLHAEDGVLTRIASLLRRNPQTTEKAAPPATSPADSAGGKSTSQPALPPAPTREVNSSSDVIATIEKVIAFYQREPSSPVPMILKRARGLIGLSFTEAVIELFGKDQLTNLGPLSRGEDPAPNVPTDPNGNNPKPNPATDSPAAPTTSIPPIASSSDANAALDAVSIYLDREEPSSPVLLLLTRARRLIAADFRTSIVDILGTGLAAKVDALAGGGKSKP